MQISELEVRGDSLVEENKQGVLEWGSPVVNSSATPSTVNELCEHGASLGVKDILARFEVLNPLILDKKALLSERLEEQAGYNSLGWTG